LRVFISFASRDREAVRELDAQLRIRRPEISCFLDERGLTGGVYWIPRLGEELGKADVVLLLLGETIGRWQEIEYYEALQLSRQSNRGGRPRIIPVVIADRPSPGLAFLSTLHQIFALDLVSASALSAIEIALSAVPTGEVVEPWRRFQPYKGLPALTETDAAFFFGRENETTELLDLLARSRGRIVALIGQSGVGKSSLVLAGVLSRLKSQLPPIDGASWPPGLKDSRSYLQLTVRPGRDPVKELAVSLVRLYGTDDAAIDKEASEWTARFRDGSLLRDMLRLTREKIAERQGGYPPKRFVLYVDQGEELYTRIPLRDTRLFSSLLADAAEDETFSILMSLRSDFYQDFQNDDAIFGLSKKFDVRPLTRDVLIDAIRKPAEVLGASFEDANMAPLIAEATQREPGALPLLSDLLQEMWLNMLSRGDGVLRWSDQPGIVDIGLPLKRRADAFLELPTTDPNVVRRLFTLRLAQVAQIGEPVRRRARKSECTPVEWSVAEQLAASDQRLLMISNPLLGDEPIVEVAHEQLLQRWPKLKAWLNEQREFLIWRTEAEQAAKVYGELPAAQKPEALLMGLRLTTAETWFEQRGDDLAPELHNYVKASIEQRDITADQRRREREEEQARRLADAQSLADANQRTAQRTFIGLVVALALAVAAVVVGAVAWVKWGAAEAARNDAEIALSSAMLAQGDVQGAAGRALQAFEDMPTPASRAALFQAALEISPYLERRVTLTLGALAIGWVDSQTVAIAESNDHIRFLKVVAGQPTTTKISDSVQKHSNEEPYTFVADIKALESGSLIAALNNGAINVFDRDGAVYASHKVELSGVYASAIRILDTGQDTLIAMFADSQRLRLVKCKIDQQQMAISCKAAPTPPVDRILSFTADREGKRIFVARAQDSPAKDTDSLIEVYDEMGNRLLDPLPFNGKISNLSLSGDDGILAFTLGNRVQFLDARHWRVLSTSVAAGCDDASCNPSGLPTNVWRPEHMDIPASCPGYSVCLLNGDQLQQGERVFRNAEQFKGHRAEITHLAWDPTGKRLATRDVNNELLIWSFEQSGDVSRNLLSAVEQRHGALIAMAPDRKSIAVATSSEHQVGVVEIGGTEGKTPTYFETTASVQALAITSKRIYASSPKGLAVSTIATRQPLKPIELGLSFAGYDTKLVWSGQDDDMLIADSNQIASIDASGSDPPAPKYFDRPKVGEGLFGLTVDRKRRQVLVSYRDGPIVAFDLATRSPVDTLKNTHVTEKAERIGSGSLSIKADSRLLAVSGAGNFVVVYDLDRRASLLKLTAQQGEVVSVAFNPSGKKLAALDGLGGLTIWDFRSDGAERSLATRAIPLAVSWIIKEGNGAPPDELIWCDDSHLLVSGGVAPLQVISVNEFDWARRIVWLGYKFDKLPN
jgi:WD40 repeat protein